MNDAAVLGFEPRSTTFRTFLSMAGHAAASDSVVLLRGERGTGKSYFARVLHEQSARRTNALVRVDCSRGDLVDAIQQVRGGTLFLDEVGELPSAERLHLLELLRAQRTDVRIVATTSSLLEAENSHLGEELLHLLNVVTLVLPPLRVRTEDIVPLARTFLAERQRSLRRHGLQLSVETERALLAHSWPGNAHELRNAIERAVLVAARDQLTPTDLGLPQLESASDVQVGALVSLQALEREHIARVMARIATFEAAAKVLGIDATTLQRKRRRYRLG